MNPENLAMSESKEVLNKQNDWGTSMMGAHQNDGDTGAKLKVFSKAKAEII